MRTQSFPPDAARFGWYRWPVGMCLVILSQQMTRTQALQKSRKFQGELELKFLRRSLR
jgi:hypothetical protein